ncbi:SELE [Branchiostoma lanceolatum]|uniref:SELE protein n=1 Tax=Branchiostoma lanceolatum TaxID=7740 RepID=A0A8K0EKW4_BRALA|nr:SELE [Branchiostoma lanceolatum]
MDQSSMQTGQLQSKDSMREDVSTFQELANITVTGQPDVVRMVEMAPCGVPDVMGANSRGMARRHRRFAVMGGTWTKMELTWRVSRVEEYPYRSEPEELMEQAFQVWQEQTTLKFTRVSDPDRADIIIDFVTPDAQGNHGDDYPFSAGTLGHAFYPGDTLMTISLQDAAADSESDRKVKSHRRGVGSLEYAAVDAHRILVARVGTGGKGEGRAMRNYRSWKLVDKLLGSREETWLLKSRAEVSRDPASRAGRLCQLLTAPTNGARTPPTGANSYQDVVTFTCDRAYVRNGTASTTCQADKTWSNPVPTCTPLQCPELTAPAFGSLSTGDTSYNTVVTFKCDTGYTLNGVDNTRCHAFAGWTNKVPTCTPVQCPLLDPPTNGVQTPPTGATAYQDRVTFTCNTGYVRNGAASTTCQADKTWSNPVPTCTPVQCPALTAPANGAQTPPKGAISYPNVVTFTCYLGFDLNGASDTTCQANGTWSNPVPTCTRILDTERTTPPLTTKSDIPNICAGDLELDAITVTGDGKTYAFKGNYFWEMMLGSGTGSTAHRVPKLISEVWGDLPGDLDAAVYFRIFQKIFFFKGDQFWRYTNTQVDPGYPRAISAVWRNLPNDTDSAFIWSGDGRLYFTKDDQYYRYTVGRGVARGYPRDLSMWKGVPADGVDAVTRWIDSKTYFFKGSQYWRINDEKFSVDPGYPRSTAQDWFGCMMPTPTLPPKLRFTLPSKLPFTMPSKLPPKLPLITMPSKLPPKLPLITLPSKLPPKLPLITLASKLPPKLPFTLLAKLPTKLPAKVPTKLPDKVPTKLTAKLPTKLTAKLPTKVPPG